MEKSQTLFCSSKLLLARERFLRNYGQFGRAPSKYFASPAASSSQNTGVIDRVEVNFCEFLNPITHKTVSFRLKSSVSLFLLALGNL